MEFLIHIRMRAKKTHTSPVFTLLGLLVNMTAGVILTTSCATRRHLFWVKVLKSGAIFALAVSGLFALAQTPFAA